MKARIITIGDEILIGQIVDTNSAWLATELNALGFQIESIVSIADTREAIHHALNQVTDEIDLVLMTGGLGPTKDDITKTALEAWFGGGWKTDPMVLERVKDLFASRGVPMPQVNVEQARIPELCTVLLNEQGTAPGMWFEIGETIFVSMPGVPYEMKHIFSERVIPRLKTQEQHEHIAHRVIMTQGIGESSLMEIIADWEEGLKVDGLKLAYLPSPGIVRLRVSGYVSNEGSILQRIDEHVQKILPKIDEYVFGFDDEKLEEVVGRLLTEQHKTVAVAESCTGGLVSHLLTSIPGASAYLLGSAVTYSNDAKVNLIGVQAQDIVNHGAVSETVAIQMAEGARKTFGSDFAIATTGVAGPDGGTKEKPVGTVWIGVASPNGSYAKKYLMGTHRGRNIRKSALQALGLLRKEILLNEKVSAKGGFSLKEN